MSRPAPLPSSAPDQASAEEAPTPRLGLSPVQVAGGALAAVTSAVAASFFGVAGTLIGAALGSVVSSVAAAVYSASLARAAERSVKITKTLVVRATADEEAAGDPAALPPDLDPAAFPVDESTTGGSAPPGSPSLLARIPWRPVAMLAGLVFVVAMGVLTVTEGVLGHPVSSTTGSGTTFGQVTGIDSGSGSSDPSPSPSTTASPTATPTGETSPSPTDDAEPTARSTDGGTASPSPSASAPSTSDQTAPPSSSAPAPQPTGGSGGGAGSSSAPAPAASPEG